MNTLEKIGLLGFVITMSVKPMIFVQAVLALMFAVMFLIGDKAYEAN